MPNRSERLQTLLALQQTIPQVQTQVFIQAMMDDAERMDAEMEMMEAGWDGGGEDEGDAQEETDSFQLLGHSCVAALCEAYNKIASSRYLGSRPIWRDLSSVRVEQLEFQFGMDAVWFKNTVRAFTMPCVAIVLIP
jgi:hypothetical protein